MDGVARKLSSAYKIKNKYKPKDTDTTILKKLQIKSVFKAWVLEM